MVLMKIKGKNNIFLEFENKRRDDEDCLFLSLRKSST